MQLILKVRITNKILNKSYQHLFVNQVDTDPQTRFTPTSNGKGSITIVQNQQKMQLFEIVKFSMKLHTVVGSDCEKVC